MSAAVIAALSLLQPHPLPEASYLVVDTTGGGALQPTHLFQNTHRLLTVMNDLDLLGYQPSPLDSTTVSACLSNDDRGRDRRPTAAQHACIRAAASGADGPPVMTILIGYTRAAGAWQEMDCIGPAGVGRIDNVYVDAAFTWHAGRRQRVRDLMLTCVNDALTGQTASAAAQ